MLPFLRHNPKHDATECHVAGSCKNTRCDEDEDGLDDEWSTIAEVVNRGVAASKAKEFHGREQDHWPPKPGTVEEVLSDVGEQHEDVHDREDVACGF